LKRKGGNRRLAAFQQVPDRSIKAIADQTNFHHVQSVLVNQRLMVVAKSFLQLVYFDEP